MQQARQTRRQSRMSNPLGHAHRSGNPAMPHRKMALRPETSPRPHYPKQLHTTASVVLVTGHGSLPCGTPGQSGTHFLQAFGRHRRHPATFPCAQGITIKYGPTARKSPFLTSGNEDNMHRRKDSGLYSLEQYCTATVPDLFYSFLSAS